MRPLFVLAFMFPLSVQAVECTVRSGAQVVPVIELYTSEGCSSCPPADRWFSSLAGAAAAGRVVPLAFHVNYWDYIGWKDVFASDRATERQRAIQRTAGARYVYTPQVVLGGRDFPEWRSGAWERSLDSGPRKPAMATIELEMRADGARGIEVASTVQAAAGVKADELVVVVATTQDGLSSRVTAGENRGERLLHDFVVRDFAAHRGAGKATSTFKAAGDWNPARMRVAAFVQNVRTGEILQALSTPLCPGG